MISPRCAHDLRVASGTGIRAVALGVLGLDAKLMNAPAFSLRAAFGHLSRPAGFEDAKKAMVGSGWRMFAARKSVGDERDDTVAGLVAEIAAGTGW